MGFFKSFFSGKSDSPANEKQKNEQKNFEIFKYDGMRAQRMGRTDYAIKCFTEALAIQEDFETMGYLAQVYTQTSELDEAHKLLERMTEIEPDGQGIEEGVLHAPGVHAVQGAGTYLHLPQSCQRMLHAGRLSRHGRSGKEGYRNRRGQRHGTLPARQSRQWARGRHHVHRPSYESHRTER